MSDHFSSALPGLFANAEKDLRLAIRYVTAEFSKPGSDLRNSRYSVYVAEACFEEVPKYAQALITWLEQFGSENTVIQTRDYDSAVASVSHFVALASDTYEEIRKRDIPFGDKRPPFDMTRMHSVEVAAINDIETRKAVFRSKRSFRSWLFADLRKVGVFPTIIAIGAGLAGGLLKGLILP